MPLMGRTSICLNYAIYLYVGYVCIYYRSPNCLFIGSVILLSLISFIGQLYSNQSSSWKRQITEERHDVMLRQGKAHEWRDAEVKHLREQRDAEPDKASHVREQEQRDWTVQYFTT